MKVRIFVFAVALTACVNSVGARVDVPAIGSRALVAIDGGPLPWRGTSSFTLRGSLDIQSNNRYVLSQTDSLFAGGPAIVSTSQGAWLLEQNTLALRDASNVVLALGTVSATGDTVNVFMSPHTFAYARK